MQVRTCTAVIRLNLERPRPLTPSMNRPLSLRLAALLLMILPCIAAAETVEDILHDQQQNGFSSPAAAIQRLQAASDVPNGKSLAEAQRRYYSELAMLGQLAKHARVTTDSLAVLDRLAGSGQCSPCKAQKLLIQAHWALTQRQPAEARNYIAQAEPLIKPDEDALVQELHYVRSRLFASDGNLSKGVTEAVKAAEMADALGERAEQLRILTTLLSINLDLKYYDRGEVLAKEIYAEAERTNYAYVMGLVRLNQGHMYSGTKQRDKQVLALKEALRIAEKDSGLSEVEVISLSNLADYYLATDNPKEALVYARRAEALARKTDNLKSLSVATINVGISLARLGDYDAGIPKILEAIAIAEKMGNKPHVVGMTDALINVYESAGRYREAVEAMHKISALNQEMIQQEREKAVLELQEKYSAERKTREIEKLSQENRLKQAEVQARTWQQRLWAAMAVALALASIPLIQLLKRVRKTNRKLAVDNAVLAEQSVHDPLTGAFNRRHCQTLMSQQETVMVGRTRDPDYTSCIGLVLLDVDFFKHINDTYGHAAGDRVLVELSERLRELVRDQDAVVRWGGEEFVLVLPGTTAQGLEVLAERVLHKIGNLPVTVGETQIPVTVSAGCVAYPFFRGQHWEDALGVADLALYQSKAQGRNRATCLMSVADKADLERVRSDIAAAEAAGDVQLHTVLGPGSAAGPERRSHGHAS